MGFLVTIKYHPKLENGKFEYDMDQEKEKSFKIGEKEEETSQEKLAIAILKQLSRRDVLVKEVEVVEFIKKTLKVRESKNGIIIGHKKYSFDDVKNLDSVHIEEIDSNNISNVPSQQAIQANISQPQVPQNLNPIFNVIREEYFEPDPAYQKYNQQFKQMGLTIGKKYKIIKEIGTPTLSGGIDVIKYKVINDTNGKIDVPIQHFTAIPTGTQLDQHNASENHSPEIPLNYGETHGGIGNMPVLRP